MSEKTCKNCKHYSKSVKCDGFEVENFDHVIIPYGFCDSVNTINYFMDFRDANTCISHGNIGGDNIIVSEAFGCINFTDKDERGPEK